MVSIANNIGKEGSLIEGRSVEHGKSYQISEHTKDTDNWKEGQVEGRRRILSLIKKNRKVFSLRENAITFSSKKYIFLSFILKNIS